MLGSLAEALSVLLADSQALLDSPEPSFETWEEYKEGRDALFSSLNRLASQMPKDADEAAALRNLMISIREKDRLLVQKIQRVMSSIRREMEAVAEQHRLVKTYHVKPGAAHSLHRFTA